MYDYSVATITLHDLLEMNSNFLSIFNLEKNEQTEKFKNMFMARYDIYEIGGETIPLFKRYLENTFNMKKDYYQELINDYEDKIDYLNGYVSHIETNDNYEHNENYERNNQVESITGDNTNNIDLPNKQTNAEYITSKIKRDNSQNANINETTSNNRTRKNDIIVNKTGGVNILQQKDYYQKYLKNVYLDFVDEFKTCFVLIY